MLMISLSIYRGDGTGVLFLFNRLLHLQRRKNDTPQEGKEHKRQGGELKSSSLYLVFPFPLFLPVLVLIRFKKQNKGKELSWRGGRTPICEEQEGLFSHSKGTKERR